MSVIFSYASCRRLPYLLFAAVDHMRFVNGLRHKRRRTWMVVAMACWMVHRLPIPVSLRIVALRRLLYLCEFFSFFFLTTLLSFDKNSKLHHTFFCFCFSWTLYSRHYAIGYGCLTT